MSWQYNTPRFFDVSDITDKEELPQLENKPVMQEVIPFSTIQDTYENKVLIGVPYAENFSGEWTYGMAALSMPNNMSYILHMQKGQPVDIARNIMVSNALKKNTKYLFFVDSDILLKPDTLAVLASSQLPIISGLYFNRSNYNVTAIDMNGNEVRRDTIISIMNQHPGSTVQVGAVGTGCLLIDMRVIHRVAQFHNLQFRCFNFHKDSNKEGNKNTEYSYTDAKKLNYTCPLCQKVLVANFFDYRVSKTDEKPLSEDYYFCSLVNEAGFNIMIHTGVVVAHEIKTGKVDQYGVHNTTKSSSDNQI